MNVKDVTTKNSSVLNPEDEAPDLTTLDLSKGWFERNGQRISDEEGKAAFRTMLGKRQVNMYLDVEVIEYFKAKAGGRGYQTLINETLRQAIERETLEQTLRRVIREELRITDHLGGK